MRNTEYQEYYSEGLNFLNKLQQYLTIMIAQPHYIKFEEKINDAVIYKIGKRRFIVDCFVDAINRYSIIKTAELKQYSNNYLNINAVTLVEMPNLDIKVLEDYAAFITLKEMPDAETPIEIKNIGKDYFNNVEDALEYF